MAGWRPPAPLRPPPARCPARAPALAPRLRAAALLERSPPAPGCAGGFCSGCSTSASGGGAAVSATDSFLGGRKENTLGASAAGFSAAASAACRARPDVVQGFEDFKGLYTLLLDRRKSRQDCPLQIRQLGNYSAAPRQQRTFPKVGREKPSLRSAGWLARSPKGNPDTGVSGRGAALGSALAGEEAPAQVSRDCCKHCRTA